MSVPAQLDRKATWLTPRQSTASRLAWLIEDEIAAAGWPNGKSLGSLDSLAAKYAVGRQIMRETVRILEMRGSCHLRRGPGGGLFVSCPKADRTALALAGYLRSRDVTVAELSAGREIVDRAALRLAAVRAETPSVMTLRTRLARWRSPASFSPHEMLRAHYVLRVALADLADNVALSLFSRCLTLFSAALSEQIYLPGIRDLLVDFADEVLAALAGRPYALAKAVAIARRIDEQVCCAVGQEMPLKAAVQLDSADHRTANQPYALRLARNITNDLVAHWPAGTRLGSEEHLAALYNVDQLTIRQTIRLLEEYGMVVTRPGKKNGIYSALNNSWASSARACTAFFCGRELAFDRWDEARRVLCTDPSGDGMMIDTFRAVLGHYRNFATGQRGSSLPAWTDRQLPQV